MPAAAVDASISNAAALIYWNSVNADVNGMLGGYPQISRIDLQGSANFLAKLRLSRSKDDSKVRFTRAVDCGAGIGRITRGFLANVAEVVDIVEPVRKFTDEIVQGSSFAELREQGRIGEVFNVGLEDWTLEQRKYDLIWNQWCLGQIKDAQLVEYLHKCAINLAERGWIVVKENLSTHTEGHDVFDEIDSSVTRTDGKFRALFNAAGLQIVATELQRGFPQSLGLYPVRMYALQPAK